MFPTVSPESRYQDRRCLSISNTVHGFANWLHEHGAQNIQIESMQSCKLRQPPSKTSAQKWQRHLRHGEYGSIGLFADRVLSLML
jgi:hypothetical protein